jgi:hypothetical protein
MVSSSGSQCFFVRHDIATSIVNKVEFGPNNKLEKSIDGVMIKEICIKVSFDRLGRIIVPKSTNTYQMKDDKHMINEPSVAYSGSKKITISNSYEDSENSQLNYWAGLTPQERFADFYELMNRFYKFVKPDWSTKEINID